MTTSLSKCWSRNTGSPGIIKRSTLQERVAAGYRTHQMRLYRDSGVAAFSDDIAMSSGLHPLMDTKRLQSLRCSRG